MIKKKHQYFDCSEPSPSVTFRPRYFITSWYLWETEKAYLQRICWCISVWILQ